MFDLESVLVKYIRSFLLPDYTALRTEIEQHTYVRLKYEEEDRTNPYLYPYLICRIMFVNQESVILEEVFIRPGPHRFKLHNIMLCDWAEKFYRYEGDCHDPDWEDGGKEDIIADVKEFYGIGHYVN